CRKLFGHVTVYAKDAGKGGKGRDIYIGSRALYVLMHEVLGLNHGADSKKVPQIAFSFSPANLSAFLRGYFSGDGGIYENQKGVGTVEASTVSQELADQVLYLLLCFGIVGTAYEKAEKHGLPAVRICMTGEPLRRFAQHVRFMEGEKSLRLSRCLGIGQWHRARRIPFGGHLRDLVVPRLPDYGKCASIGANVLNDWSEESGNEGLSELCASDIHWDRVESVTRVQDEEFVYDIAVEPCQNFAGGFGGIYAHNSEKNVTELFSTAHKNAPCILFFDEIDSLAKRRDRQSNDDVGPRIMSTLLSEMDGFKVKNGKAVIVIGATNIPDQLDPAIMRPGRLDKIIYMHLPDKAAREAIFGVHLSKLPLSPDVDVKKLAASTERFSGADIANVVNEAVRLAAREASAKNAVVPISQKHLLSVLAHIRPSTSLDSLSSYEQFRLDFERRSGAAPEEKKEGAVTFEDVVGLDDVRQALREAVDIPLLHPDLIKEYKIRPSRGLLLFGPPGCGKTMIVRAASHDLNATFLSLSGADLLKKGPANSERTLHEIFNRAREQAPALIFIDEIEALTPSRSQYASPVLTQILQEMDGLTELKNVMVVGATNKPSSLDSAILRPGRFDKILYIPPPDAKSRAALFAKNLSFLNPALDFAALSRSSEGFSGADIASVCQEAKMGMVRTRITDQTAGAGGSTPLTQDMLESILSQRRPSITDADLMEYERFKLEYGERR
ncbi:MAG: AAA family ATPase, partial [Candidatus Micrarchaeota archaeon]